VWDSSMREGGNSWESDKGGGPREEDKKTLGEKDKKEFLGGVINV